MTRRIFDDAAVTFATAGRRRVRRPRLAVSGRRLAVWAIAPWLAAAVTVPMPATATGHTEGTADQATVTDELVKLTPSDGSPFNHFGNEVAVSGDTAVVGAPKMHHSAFTGPGAAYVFTRVGDSWTEQAKLTASDGVPGDRFGWSVAISGETIVVGAFWDDVGANVDQGSAYVFTRTAGTWREQAKLTASQGVAGHEFGISVAVSDNDVVVGAMSLTDEVAVPPQGSAYVFTRSGGHWTQQAELAASDRVVGDGFGFKVDIDGDTAVVGARRAKGGQGSAYVFSRRGGAWTQQKILHARDGVADDTFGFWVAVDDDTIVVGDPSDDGQGSAYVFTRTGGHWAEQEKLTASDGAAGDYFGRSVAVSGDTVVVGAQFDDAGPKNNDGQGSAYVFERTGTNWSEKAHLIADDGAEKDLFGVSVGVSGDTAVVGASFHTVGAAQGAAYVWRAATDRARPDKSLASSARQDLSNERPVGSNPGLPARPSSASPAQPASAGSTDAGLSDDVNGGASGSDEPGASTDAELLVGSAVREDSRPSSFPAGWGILLLLVISASVVRVRKALGRG